MTDQKKKFKIPKKIKKHLPMLVAIILVGVVSFVVGRQIGLNTDTSAISTTTKDVAVETHTIKKTLTSSGEIGTAKTENLTLNTSKYFATMLVEEDDIVKSGENILQYTDGTYLTAPYDLVISSINAPSANSIATSSHYIEVKNLSDLKISLSINESEIGNLAAGSEVEIALTADNTKKYTGKISKIGAVGSYSSSGSTFTVEVELKNDGNIKLGMSANCTINLSELKDVVAVPVDAVQINGSKRYVTVVVDGRTEEREVTTGLSDDEYVEIKSGLNADETVRVISTTKQNTIRGSDSSESGFGDRPAGMPDMSNMPEGMPSGMPENMPDMTNMPEMPSGSRPSRGDRK